MTKIYKAIGLMSGTSMDGIDLALIESDGKNIIKCQDFFYREYEKSFREKLANLINQGASLNEIKLIENELTILHANLVNDFLREKKIRREEIDLIGFHGHTILHNPAQKITWQIGNGNLLNAATKIPVIADFRSADVALGGQGAPLVPIYHMHLFANQKQPCAVLNIGGVSNITFFNGNDEEKIQALDICFGNAPLDDLVKKHLNLNYDKDGALAKSGQVDFALCDKILQNQIFHSKPPRSFDRGDFAKILTPITSLKINDALASLCFIHAKAVAISLKFFNEKPQEIFICGGGRKNHALIDEIKKQLPEIKIKTTEEINLNGDAIEAGAFAFLAIRKIENLPISFKNTTGVSESSVGGVLYDK